MVSATQQIINAAAHRVGPSVAPGESEPVSPGPDLGVLREEVTEHEAGSDTQPARATPSLVAALQQVEGYPCVSLLLGTRPGARLAPDDAARLERLRLDAIRRLREEDLLTAQEELVTNLHRLVQQVTSSPTDHGLALCAGKGVATAVTVGVPVEDRTAVDPTFATRDLVRALHRTPRHVVLVLSQRRAALLDGSGGRLTPVNGTRFPMSLDTLDGRPRDAASLAAVLRGVDLSLGVYLRLHPAPVVIVGPQTVVTTFRSHSRNLDRLAGCVYGGFDDAGLDEIGRRTAPVLGRYLASREQAALDLLEQRRAERRTAEGISAVWLAARLERPEMLVVEESFRYPARLSADGDHVTPASDVEAPDVIDDLVDELIEAVLARGGWVALAHDGRLADRGRVALTLR
jgi:hypothetical protein